MPAFILFLYLYCISIYYYLFTFFGSLSKWPYASICLLFPLKLEGK